MTGRLKIAVLSLTRDRLPYTQHCFNTLHVNAGCRFDHFVLDQGSTDGTPDWLTRTATLAHFEKENVGVCRGLNILLDWVDHTDTYDVIVKVDNDCELLQRDTLKDVCDAVHESGQILSPRIQGLTGHVPTIGEFTAGVETVDETDRLGGIFMAAPAQLFQQEGYRHNPTNPPWGGDDIDLSQRWRDRGGRLGYISRLNANHYRTTRGQQAEIGWYFDRRVAEGGPA